MTNNDGDYITVYDVVTADTLGDIEGECIVVNNVDYLELTRVVKEQDSVLVRGYSHISGDSVSYILDYDTEVGLWSV